MTAMTLVMRVLHQPMPVVKMLPLPELMMWAGIAAAIEGKKFK